jgi:hypothetical protein
MPKYVIEREVPGAGKLSADELKGMAQKSCGVLQEMGPQIQWQESFVTDDKVYCIYIAPNEEAAILPRMRRLCENTLKKVSFRQIVSPRLKRWSIQPLLRANASLSRNCRYL